MRIGLLSALVVLDSSVSVTITGLPALATTTARDDRGTTWSSSARFVASSFGAVSLSQASKGGSYTGRDPTGLFDLMTPNSVDMRESVLLSDNEGDATRLSVVNSGGTIHATRAGRRDAWQHLLTLLGDQR